MIGFEAKGTGKLFFTIKIFSEKKKAKAKKQIQALSFNMDEEEGKFLKKFLIVDCVFI